MKKVIKLTESDLARIVKRVISEQVPTSGTQTTPGGVQTPTARVSLQFPDGKTLQVSLPGITDQQKLNTFLEWGGKNSIEGSRIVARNGWSELESTIKSVETASVGDDVLIQRKNYLNGVLEAVNIGLQTVAKIGNTGTYMTTVHDQINKSQQSRKSKVTDSETVAKFDKSFVAILNQQLARIRG